MNHHPVVIVGAGPAGLAAAYELIQRDIRPIVLEKADKVGGLARTETYKSYRFDVGGHRFYTRVEMVRELWEKMLGEDLLTVRRLSRIHYRGRFFNYPLDIFNTLSNLGIMESALILLSYLQAQLQPHRPEETFEQWVTNRFGQRLYETFFKTYTEKVWGIPCHQIQAEWAVQRIKGLSLKKAVCNAFWSTDNAQSLIREFYYPDLGPGMMWQRFQEAVEAGGGKVCCGVEAIRVERDDGGVNGVVARCGGDLQRIAADQVISSMPLAELVTRFDPLPPEDVIRAARQLRHRDFILVGLVVNQSHLFPDNWVYVHSPEVRVGRIQNFRNWSAAMSPDARKSSLGMEYFCNEGDGLWSLSDAELIELATRELASLGLAHNGNVEDGVVFRQRQAYPVYDREYRQHLEVVRRFLATIGNVQTIGRNGMHRYNNMDHSMLTGILAARNLVGENHDLWSVNTQHSYGEETAAG